MRVRAPRNLPPDAVTVPLGQPLSVCTLSPLPLLSHLNLTPTPSLIWLRKGRERGAALD